MQELIPHKLLGGKGINGCKKRGQEITDNSQRILISLPRGFCSWVFFPSCRDGSESLLPRFGASLGQLWPKFGNQGGSQDRAVGKNCYNNKLFALKEGKVCNTIKGGAAFKGKHMSETYGSSLFERKTCLLLILYNISHRD